MRSLALAGLVVACVLAFTAGNALAADEEVVRLGRRQAPPGQTDVGLQQLRFVDNGDGTVRDSRSGLVWLRHADCFGTQTWEEAMRLTASMGDGLQCPGMQLEDGSAPGDWRLPTIREIMTLPMIEYFNPALTNSKGTGKWREGDPFLGVSSQYYWSSCRLEEDSAWYMYLYNGVLGISRITQRYSVWPVKGRIKTLLDVEP